MHIPDGLISDPLQLGIYTVIYIILLAILLNKYRKNHTEKDIPVIALFAAAILIVQLVEIPLPVPACVHISLITVMALYDLEAAPLVYTIVTIAQSFLGEGGISTLGMNLLNLAILAPIFAYYIYKFIQSYDKNLALFVSGFGTITLLGIIVSLEYAIAGTYPLMFGLTVITPIEMVVGVIEGLVTIVVMNALNKVKPELTPVLNE
ncbi:energy-coupling factor ABC transporter permease [Methanosphaera sp.]|mgnify:CR=1 FL=1|uniref:energy-coupling factor ABC transporter permease n=1 Tax=Methanosphaera sp. TaxID=2666342 RepID=UPI0025F187AF|nr:energy-coupling factor ABC transporter permease [Methanosphaera sp.]